MLGFYDLGSLGVEAMKDSTRFLIVGGGVAGMAAAERIRMLDGDSSIIVASRERHPLYYRRALAWYIAGRVSLDGLMVRPSGYYEGLGIKVLSGVEAVSLDVPNRLVETSSGRIEYEKALIATGAEPFKPKIKGIQLKRIYALRTLDDAEEIAGELPDVSDVLVVGGGLLGLNLAEAVTVKGKNAIILELGDRLCPSMLDDAASSLIIEHLHENGVSVRCGEGVEAFKGQGRVEAAFTTKGERIQCQMALIAVGVHPSIGWIRGSPIKTGRGVLVDEYLRSSVHNVYAAGDVAEAYDLVLGRHMTHTSWSNAEEQGQVAGSNMAGQALRYEGSITANVESVFGLPLVGMGLTNPTQGEYEVYTPTTGDPLMYRKIIVKGDRIVGAILVGDVREAEAIQTLIKKGLDISDYKKEIEENTINFREIV